jgi:hypothetical protein
MKEKRNYERPSMKVFELKHQSQLLVGSNLGKSSSAGVTDYTWQDVTEE